MAAAAESASFHYLQHQQVKIKPNFVQAKEVVPPTFEELWGSGDNLPRRVLKKEEKLFWRTRHRLEFIFEELRSDASIIISIREVDSDKEWRPVVVDSKVLFPLIDSKRTIKSGSGLDDDKLGRAACEFLLARLKPSNGEQPLPPWYQPKSETSETSAEGSASNEDAKNSAEAVDETLKDSIAIIIDTAKNTANENEQEVLVEQQAIIDKLSHDTWEFIEREPTQGTLDGNRWLVERKEKLMNERNEGNLESVVEKTMHETEPPKVEESMTAKGAVTNIKKVAPTPGGNTPAKKPVTSNKSANNAEPGKEIVIPAAKVPALKRGKSSRKVAPS